MKRSRLRKSIWAAALAVIVAGALALAACGGSSTTASSTTEASTPSAAATTALPQAVITDYPATPLPTPTVAGTIAFVKTIKVGGAAHPQSDLYVVKTDGSGLKQLTDARGMETGPSWSPDGRKIAYELWAGSGAETVTLWLMNADGSHQAKLTKGAVRGWGPKWSPDGEQIAFARVLPPDSRNAVYVMNADGSGMRAVSKALTYDGADAYEEGWGLDWTPDGRILAVKSGEVVGVNLDGSDLAPLTDGADVGTFALSPDGSQMVLQNSITEVSIAPVEGDGSALKLAQSAGFLVPDPWAAFSWSPDGRALAIADSSLFGVRGSSLYIVNADGSGLSAVPGIDKADDPAWRPE